VALLAAEPFGLDNGNALKADFLESFFDSSSLKGLMMASIFFIRINRSVRGFAVFSTSMGGHPSPHRLKAVHFADLMGIS
jgi:hypothetical protein